MDQVVEGASNLVFPGDCTGAPSSPAEPSSPTEFFPPSSRRTGSQIPGPSFSSVPVFLTLSFSNFKKFLIQEESSNQEAMNVQAGCAHGRGHRAPWLRLRARRQGGAAGLPSLSAEGRGRKGWELQAELNVLPWKEERGLSSDNQENLENRCNLQNKTQPPRPENKMPTLGGLLVVRPHGCSLGGPPSTWPAHLEDPRSQISSDNCPQPLDGQERGLEEEF